jgi:hypothetical protein
VVIPVTVIFRGLGGATGDRGGVVVGAAGGRGSSAAGGSGPAPAPSKGKEK